MLAFGYANKAADTLHFPIEARAVADVAGGSFLVHAQEDSVLIAVDSDLLDFLGVARRGALAPKFIAAAAPIGGLALPGPPIGRLISKFKLNGVAGVFG